MTGLKQQDPADRLRLAHLSDRELLDQPVGDLMHEIHALRSLVTKLAHDKRSMEEAIGPLQDQVKGMPQERDFWKARAELMEGEVRAVFTGIVGQAMEDVNERLSLIEGHTAPVIEHEKGNFFTPLLRPFKRLGRWRS